MTGEPAHVSKALQSVTAKARRGQLTKAQRSLLDAGAAIFSYAPTAEDKAYLARELVLASLPHKNPGNVPVWSRRNGDVSLAIQPGVNRDTGQSIGYPYGSIPRLLLFWITTEAIRTGQRRLELGPSLNSFVVQLGLSPYTGGGKRGDAARLREQMTRLFRSRFSLERSVSTRDAEGTAWLDMQVAPKGELWWNVSAPDQGALWGSWIELGEDFREAITSAPVPVDMRALRALKKSPLALDLYAWLTFQAFRAHKSGKSRFETWEQLHAHMGGEYADVGDFRKKAKAALRKIGAVYRGLQLGARRGGIEVLPESYPAIQPRDVAPLEGSARDVTRVR